MLKKIINHLKNKKIMKTEKTLAMTLVGLLVVGVFTIAAVFKNEGNPLVKLPTVKSVVIVVEK